MLVLRTARGCSSSTSSYDIIQNLHALHAHAYQGVGALVAQGQSPQNGNAILVQCAIGYTANNGRRTPSQVRFFRPF